MSRKPLLIAACVLLLAGLALAANSDEPPAGWPNIVWALLGVALPWIYGSFLTRLPGWLRFVVSWGITFALVAFVDLVLLRWSLGQFAASIAVVITVMQSVYQMMTKPQAQAKALRDSTLQR
jgi:hypothetical protein